MPDTPPSTRLCIALAGAAVVLLALFSYAPFSEASRADGRRVAKHADSGAPSTQSVATPPPAQFNIGPKLERGIFLVASPGMLDPNFAKTVVLLVEYSSEGAIGLIINRPTEHALSKVLPDIPPLRSREDPVYLGGPVAPDNIIVLMRAFVPPGASQHVVGNIYASASQVPLMEMLERDDPGEGFLAFAGHAGWAPGQLDGELARGGWRLTDADEPTVFELDAMEVWPALIRRTSGLWVLRSVDTP